VPFFLYASLSISASLHAADFQSSISSNGIYQQYAEQAEEILDNMTKAEKIGQMVLPTFKFLTANRGPNALQEAIDAWYVENDLYQLGLICGFDAISEYHIGAVLQDAGPLPYSGDDQTVLQWRKLATMANLFYNGPTGTNLLLGTDSVHGDQHVTGTILFPHNIGLGATHNPEVVQRIGHWTNRNMQSTGFNWSFSPTVAVGYDYRWGRQYECYSQNLDVLKSLATHYVTGIQRIRQDRLRGVLGNAKHFIADGDTEKGKDEGYAYTCSLNQVWKKNGAGYEGAVDASVGSIMASYSSLNDVPMHFGGAYDILNKFVNDGISGSHGKKYRMDGFVVSDFVGVSRAAYKCLILKNQCGLLKHLHIDKCFKRYLQTLKGSATSQQFCCTHTSDDLFELYVRAVAKAVNAGVDMLMVANSAAFVDPFDYQSRPPYDTLSPLFYSTKIKRVVNAIDAAVDQGLISKERFNQAVKRILCVKLSMYPTVVQPLTPQELNDEAVSSLRAAEQSLVLLKNEHSTLPVRPDTIQNVFLMGAFNDIGSQNGGWTVTWQGQKGNQYWEEGSIEKLTSRATSILDGVTNVLGNTPNYIQGEAAALAYDLQSVNRRNSVAIIAIAEPPYAEYNGDIDNNNPWYIKGALTGENIYNSPIQPKFLGVEFTCEQLQAIKRLKQAGVKIVTVLFSGRPVVITEGPEAPLPPSDAFIAAFLPATSGGQAIANAIFGNYGFKSVKQIIEGKTYYSNTLPFAWPADMQDVRTHEYKLFPIEYGLKTTAF